jgi:threonine aldolase
MTMSINLASDNVAGCAPEIMAALTAAMQGTAPSYGADALTASLERRLAEIFERPVAAFPVATGTAANVLSLASLVPPWGAVLCHRDAHVEADECGAPEFFTGGAKLVLLDGEHGRVTPQAVADAVPPGVRADVHHVQPRALSLTQATEAGTVYGVAEVAALADAAHARGLKVHMDGARFANAVVHLGCSPAEATWKAGVDVLSFGGTKNGCLAAEAVVFFDPALAADFAFRRKRGAQLFSKMRVLSSQLDAYLADDLWLRLARHANGQAARLADGLARLPGATLTHPVEANEVFVRLPEAVWAGLPARGIRYAPWNPARREARFVTAFNTDPAEVDAALSAAADLVLEGPVAASA